LSRREKLGICSLHAVDSLQANIQAASPPRSRVGQAKNSKLKLEIGYNLPCRLFEFGMRSCQMSWQMSRKRRSHSPPSKY
jgi:hypothetical protein